MRLWRGLWCGVCLLGKREAKKMKINNLKKKKKMGGNKIIKKKEAVCAMTHRLSRSRV